MEITLLGPISILLGTLSCFIGWIAVNGEEEGSRKAELPQEQLARIKHFEKRFNFTVDEGETLEYAIKDLSSEMPKAVITFGDTLTDMFRQYPAKNKSELMDCIYTFSRSVALLDPDFVEVARDVQVKEGTDKRIDILLIFKKHHLGVIIEGEYNGNSEVGLNRTIDNKFLDVFKTPKFAEHKIKHAILMAISVTPTGGFSVSYIINSTDIADAITMIRA